MAELSRRVRRQSAKIQRILAAARRCFSQGSFQAGTMRAIAEEAGVSVGTLYTYFRDKAALADAVSAEDLARVLPRALESLPPGTVRERLMHVFSEFYEHHRQNMELSRVVVRELSLADDPQSPGREERFMGLFAALASIVGEGQARGELDPEVSPFDLAVNAFGLHYFYLVGWLARQPGFAPPEAHLERGLALLFRGVEQQTPGLPPGEES